jgi:hypothetical protein
MSEAKADALSTKMKHSTPASSGAHVSSAIAGAKASSCPICVFFCNHVEPTLAGISSGVHNKWALVESQLRLQCSIDLVLGQARCLHLCTR